MRPSSPLPAFLRAILMAFVFAYAAPAAFAVVDDAHSTALETAIGEVKKGFKIRQEYWKGKITSGEQTMVKHQLFKGSDVWFWLATSTPKVKIEIEIYDDKGTKVAVEKKEVKDCTGIKLTAPKTGTYRIVFKMTGKEKAEIDWALVYGWK
ncbi:MAG TPA: hypothetical protein VG796_06615 [Verrucomicrobiales bacterium]|jgi:hypothetical protein|nr:hypothetical protein [Verrucomicrobiales bacterium]